MTDDTFIVIQKENLFHKSPPESLDPVVAHKRLIHEAVYTLLAQKVNRAAGSPLLIPDCELIFENGMPKELVTTQIPYNFCGDVFCSGKMELQKIIKNLKFASAQTLGYLLADPDRSNNTGFNKNRFSEITHMCCIDFGLSDYAWLEENHLLLKKEHDRLPKELSYATFQITHQPLGKIFSRRRPDQKHHYHYVFTLIHDTPFDGIPAELNKLNAEDKSNFLNEIKRLLTAYITVTTKADFKNCLLTDLLGQYQASETSLNTMNKLIDRIIMRGTNLKDNYNPTKFSENDLSKLLDRYADIADLAALMEQDEKFIPLREPEKENTQCNFS